MAPIPASTDYVLVSQPDKGGGILFLFPFSSAVLVRSGPESLQVMRRQSNGRKRTPGTKMPPPWPRPKRGLVNICSCQSAGSHPVMPSPIRFMPGRSLTGREGTVGAVCRQWHQHPPTRPSRRGSHESPASGAICRFSIRGAFLFHGSSGSHKGWRGPAVHPCPAGTPLQHRLGAPVDLST